MKKQFLIGFIFLLTVISTLSAESLFDQPLVDFAEKNGGEWWPLSEKLLFRSNNTFSFEELFTLPQEELSKIRYILIITQPLKKIEKIPSLTPLKNLKGLNIEGLGVQDISNLRNTNFEYLTLDGNNLTNKDLTPILSLTSLESLDIGSNPITEIPDLSQLPNLRQLSISYTSITSLEGLEVIKRPLRLDIYKCIDIKDYEPLKKIKITELIILEDLYSYFFAEWFKENDKYFRETPDSRLRIKFGYYE